MALLKTSSPGLKARAAIVLTLTEFRPVRVRVWIVSRTWLFVLQAENGSRGESDPPYPTPTVLLASSFCQEQSGIGLWALSDCRAWANSAVRPNDFASHNRPTRRY